MSIKPTREDYDDMHHALGRPRQAYDRTHRNYYCVGKHTPTATRFIELGWWTLDGTINGGRDGIYRVNETGRLELQRFIGTPDGQDMVRRMSR